MMPSAAALRVLFFLPTLHGGGAQRAILNLAEGLQARGYNVELVVGDARGELASAIPRQVTVVDLRCPRLRSAVIPLARYLRQHQPDCLLSTVTHANVVALLAAGLARGRTRSVVRLSSMLSAKAQGTALRDYVTFAFARRLYRRADLLVASSRGAALDAARIAGVDVTAVKVAPSPLVPEDVAALAQEPVNHPFFAPGQPPVVLGVGRLACDKDFPALVSAFARVRRMRQVRLVILGEGPLRRQLERVADECGVADDVSLAGFVENPFQYMAASAVYVLTCQDEGMPGSLVQALACGVPVVATDCPSGPRELLEDGKHGALVPMGDVVALAEAIGAALRQPRAVAPEVWLPYRTDHAVERYAELIMALVSGDGACNRAGPRDTGRRAGRRRLGFHASLYCPTWRSTTTRRPVDSPRRAN
jgi:glycosyltransferase involved in cell wall biosynthesis